MFSDGVSYVDAIEHIFGDDSLPRIDDELRSMGGTVADERCHECNATMYELDNEVVCGRCAIVRGAGDRTTDEKTAWDYFAEQRSTYHNSNIHRCVGGYPHVYSWVDTDKIDGTVKQLDETEFYK